jgi:hypothetical protein
MVLVRLVAVLVLIAIGVSVLLICGRASAAF